jgi:hypothetical protein
LKVIVAAIAALVLAPAALGGPSLRIGVVDDAPIWNDPQTEVGLAKAAGFDSVRITAQWTSGMTAMSPGQTTRLQRAALFASMHGLEPVVSIYNASAASTPDAADERAQFVEFAKSVVRTLPWSKTFIVGNEPNSAYYWQPQFDAAGGDAAAFGYLQLLAATYDAIKAMRPDATVIGGALDSHGNDDRSAPRPSHSPAAFIRDLGMAYRGGARNAPIMDIWDQHVYGDTSASPPSMPHTAGTITQGDYGRLVSLLAKAFDGTPQRGSTLPIFYGEYGVETAVPAAKAGAYGGTEDAKVVDEATQASYYAEAFRLALCQPNVVGIMVFHTIDERALGAWQSGPYYADGSPKSSLAAIRDAANAARSRTGPACPDRTAPTVSVSTAGGVVTAMAADSVGVGKVALYANGAAVDTHFTRPYAFAWTPPRAGRYSLDVRASDAAGNVGRRLLVVDARRATRGDATTVSRWVLTPVRAGRAPRPQGPRPRG